jgi:hypothetical protein
MSFPKPGPQSPEVQLLDLRELDDEVHADRQLARELGVHVGAHVLDRRVRVVDAVRPALANSFSCQTAARRFSSRDAGGTSLSTRSIAFSRRIRWGRLGVRSMRPPSGSGRPSVIVASSSAREFTKQS